MHDLDFDAFLSYARRDEKCARYLAVALASYGLKIAFDLTEFPFGAGPGVRQGALINRSRRFLLLLSDSDIESDYQRDEASLAIELSVKRRGFIIPVLLPSFPGSLADSDLDARIRFSVPVILTCDEARDRATLESLARQLLASRALVEPSPTLPRPLDGWVARPALLEDLKGLVLGSGGGSSRTAPVIWVHGDGGAGKSILATALAWDPEIRRVFEKRIFWLAPRRGGPVARLWSLATSMDPLVASFVDVDTGTREIGRLQREGRGWVLVIVDDVEDDADVEALQRLGSSFVLVVTARAAPERPGAERALLPVGSMASGEAHAVLSTRSGRPSSTPDPAVDQMAELCGNIPMALSIAGALVARHMRTEAAHPAAWEAVAGHIRAGGSEGSGAGVTGLSPVIRAALRLLDEPSEACLTHLSVLRRGTWTTEAELQRCVRLRSSDLLVGGPLRTLRALGLVLTDATGQLAVHDAVVAEVLSRSDSSVARDCHSNWLSVAGWDEHHCNALAVKRLDVVDHMVALERYAEAVDWCYRYDVLFAHLVLKVMPKLMRDLEALARRGEVDARLLLEALQLSTADHLKNEVAFGQMLLARFVGFGGSRQRDLRDQTVDCLRRRGDPFLQSVNSGALEPPGGVVVRTFRSEQRILGGGLSPSGEVVFWIDEIGQLFLAELGTLSQERCLTSLPFQVTHVARLRDRHIAVTDSTGAVWCIPLVDGAEPHRLMDPFKADGLAATDPVARLAVSWEGTFIARASRSGVVDILRFDGDVERRPVRLPLPMREGEADPVNRRVEVTEAAIDRDGNVLLSTNDRVLWHWKSEQSAWRWSSVESAVGSVAALSFCMNNHATVSAHATVGLVLWTLSGPLDPSALMRSAEGLQPRAMSIAADGEHLVIANQSSGVALYSTNDVQWRRFLHRCDRPVIAHGITTAPHLICVISMDRKVQVLRLEPDPGPDRGAPVITFPGGAGANDGGAVMGLVSSGEMGACRVAIEDQDTLVVFRLVGGADERICTFRCDVRLDGARLAGSYIDVETQGGERLAFILHRGHP